MICINLYAHKFWLIIWLDGTIQYVHKTIWILVITDPIRSDHITEYSTNIQTISID